MKNLHPKKITACLLSVALLCALAACGQPPAQQSAPANQNQTAQTSSTSQSSQAAQSSAASSGWKSSSSQLSQAPESASARTSSAAAPNAASSAQPTKTLVVYFSLPETTKTEALTEDEENSVIVMNGKALGNTQYLASLIQENTGADLFRIKPQTPYPADHRALTDFAKREQNQNARPALSAAVENFDQYDTVFVGYPNWWGDMPMLVYTFFDENDFAGKTVIPFNTHGGSGFSGTIDTIAKLEPDATVYEDGLSISRDDMQDAASAVKSWLDQLKHDG